MERDIYKALSLKVADSKAEPAVWVSRLAIYEELKPEPKLIRNIPLQRGLNIIWAEESEDDDPTVDITGHSAGKTTFCRLLRYVLGETTFGRKSNVRMIKGCLPHGYVAAELRVWDEDQKRHRQWAVLACNQDGSARIEYHVLDGQLLQIEDRANEFNPHYHTPVNLRP